MTRIMRKNGNAEMTAPASPDKVASYEISEDEAGMRLDRWLHRRFPDVSNSHLMRIVRKGEVRVSGKRADISTRLAAGERVRVPPLKIAPQGAPAIKRANPDDAEAIRAMVLFQDRDVMVLNKPFGLAVQGGSGTTRHVDGMLQALADKEGNRPVLVHRLDRDTSGVLLDRQIAQNGGGAWRDLPLAPGQEDLLGAGRGRAQARAGADFHVSRQGRGHERQAGAG